MSANPPARSRSRRKPEPIERISADALILADGAQVADGKLYILGGGWDVIRLGSPAEPIPVFALAFRIVIPWNLTNEDIAVEIQIVDPDGATLLGDDPPVVRTKVGRPPNLESGVSQALPFAMTFQNFPFPKSGQYFVRLREGERDLNQYRFSVVFLNNPAT